MLLNRLLGDVRAHRLRDTGTEETRPTKDERRHWNSTSDCMFTCVILLFVLVASHLSVYEVL